MVVIVRTDGNRNWFWQVPPETKVLKEQTQGLFPFVWSQMRQIIAPLWIDSDASAPSRHFVDVVLKLSFGNSALLFEISMTRASSFFESRRGGRNGTMRGLLSSFAVGYCAYVCMYVCMY